MLRCKLIGHQFGKYEIHPVFHVKKIPSLIKKCKRTCVRCGKIDISYVLKM